VRKLVNILKSRKPPESSMFGVQVCWGPTAADEHINDDAHAESAAALVALSPELIRAWALESNVIRQITKK
jgi:hypothetical protein